MPRYRHPIIKKLRDQQVRYAPRAVRLEELERASVRHAGRYLSGRVEEDGMVEVRGRLSPEAGAALMKALEAAGDRVYREGERPGEWRHPGVL